MRVLALIAAAVAAAVLPHAPLGVNVAIVGVLVALTVTSRASRSVDAWLFGGLALALVGMAAWLDAGWVVAADLVAAVLLATVAVAGVHVLAPVAPVRALADAPALVPAPPAEWMPAARGVVLGSILVLPFGGLFWSADAVFAELGSSAPFPSLTTLPARIAVFALVLLFALGLALAARRLLAQRVPPTPSTLTRGEWIIPLVLLNALFLAFVAVQLTVLFGGSRHVLETAGLTYAEYAREGFWQLIAAATLTLAVIAAALRLSSLHSRSDRLLMRSLIGMLCGLTIVIVASAFHRLQVYEDAFGLTRSRLAAETVTLALGAFFALILIAGAARPVRRNLARVALGGVGVGLLAFSLSNPDARIAERNVERWRLTGDLDVAYAQSLSADAVAALATLPEPARGVVLAPFRSRLADREPWTSWNRGRARARDRLSIRD